MKKILTFLLGGKTVHEQEKDYIKKNGYPDEDIVFSDSQGRISRIIGKNTFKRILDKLKKDNSLKTLQELHLEAIKNDTGLYTAYSVKNKEGKFTSVCSIKQAASKSAEITEQIAIEFGGWVRSNPYVWDYPDKLNDKRTTKELFQDFLKTRV
jgi:hypothetical protein